MLHDVTAVVFNRHGGAIRHTVTVDASGGDDAASRAAVLVVDFAAGRHWMIVSIGPAVQPDPPPDDAAEPDDDDSTVAPDAHVEGSDTAVPDFGFRRGPGRPRKIVAEALPE